MVLKSKKLPATMCGEQFYHVFKSPSCQVKVCEAVVAAQGAAEITAGERIERLARREEGNG